MIHLHIGCFFSVMLVFRGVTHDGNLYISRLTSTFVFIFGTCNIHLFDIIGDCFSWMFSKNIRWKENNVSPSIQFFMSCAGFNRYMISVLQIV